MLADTPRETARQARERLNKMRDENQGRAKYQQEVRKAIDLASQSLDEYEASREAELETVRLEFQAEVDRARDGAEAARAELAEARLALDGKPKRELTVGPDGNTIRFPAATDQAGRPRYWNVEEIESLAYDLRMCGADGATPVEIERTHTQAVVPFPEAALTLQQGSDEPKPEQPEGDDPRAGTELAPAVASGPGLREALILFAAAAMLSLVLMFASMHG